MTVSGTDPSYSEKDGVAVAGRSIEPDDLFRLRFVTAADLSPDGSLVVFVLTRTNVAANTDHTDLVLLDMQTGEQRQLTYVDAVNTQPAFSPDGREVAFLSSRTDGVPQIFVIPINGGEARQVTTLPRGIGGGPVWSPDGSRIAFTAGSQDQPRDPSLPYRVDRPVWRVDQLGLVEDALQDLYLVDPAGGDSARLTADPRRNTGPQWMPGGEALVYLASFDPDTLGMGNRLRRVERDGTVTDIAGGGMIASYAVCPDGRVVYVLTHPEGQPSGTRAELWVHDPATGAHECRTNELTTDVGGRVAPDMPAFAFSLGSVASSPDAQAVYVSAQQGGEVHIYRVGLSGPESHEQVAAGQRVCAPVRVRGTRLLFAAFGICNPGELYLHHVATGHEDQLTQFNADLVGELAWPTVHQLQFASSDGTTVEGWYLEPTSGQPPYPTVLGVHGGPHAGWGYTFCFDFLMLAGAGYGVLFLNQRGSTGYGDAFATAITGDWGNLDYADLMAGVDHAVQAGLADPDRLGVFGVSGGGTLTGWIIGHTDRFKAACPEGPLFNFASIYGTSDIGIWAAQTFLGGPPHERPETYRRCSPITYAHRCTTPTLFLQHENDHRSPPEQTEQFYAILKAQGVTAEMLRFPGSSHAGSVLGPVTHRRAQNEALLDWMNRHLRE